MAEIRGPHIPYKQWFAESSPDPQQDHMNWLEVERWAARLSEQVNFSWGVSLYGTLGTLAPGATSAAAVAEVYHSTTNQDFDKSTATSWQPIIPRNGLYAITVQISYTALVADSGPMPYVQATVTVAGGANGDLTMRQLEPLIALDSAAPKTFLTYARACVPCYEGDLVGLVVGNYTAEDVEYTVEHFDVVYVGELVNAFGRDFPS